MIRRTVEYLYGVEDRVVSIEELDGEQRWVEFLVRDAGGRGRVRRRSPHFESEFAAVQWAARVDRWITHPNTTNLVSGVLGADGLPVRLTLVA